MISFIIPTYNREDTIEKCLNSVYAVKCDKEVIIIDDHSNDATLSIVKEKFPKVKIIQNKKNKGPSFSRNIGIKESKGEFIFFVDSDVFLTKDILKKFLKYKDYDILFPKIIFEDKTLMYPSNEKEKMYLKASTVFLIRKQPLLDYNILFDELYYMVEEDTDFFIQCKLNNLKSKYVKEAKAIHASQSKVSLFSEKKYYLTTKNQIYAYLKYLFLDKKIKNLFEFPKFKLIFKVMIIALFNINLLSITSVEGRTKVKRNKLNILFNTEKITDRSRFVLIYLFFKAVLWNLINLDKIIKNMSVVKDLNKLKIKIYTTGLTNFYYRNVYHLKKSRKIKIDKISSRVLYNILIKLNNHFSIIRFIRKILTNKNDKIEHEPSLKTIIKGSLAPITLLFNRNIIFSYQAYSNMIYYMLLLNLLGKNTIFFTSWPYWNTNKYETKPFFNKWLWGLFLKRTKIITVSKASYNALKSLGHNPIQIPHSVDLDLYKIENKKNKKVKILYVGRLVEEKGVRDILEVASKFSKDKVEFLFIGEGPLSKLVKESNIHVKHLDYVYSVNELNRIYSESDIFVLNSYDTKTWEEWFGISLIEAMASGLAIVSTDCIGPKEIINNKVGFLIKQKDKQALYDKLKILINNPKLRRQLGKNGRDLVEENYDLKKNSKKWFRVLTSR
tara:strand:+ start:19354 stop:21360 length:2007 start_codon:yes stop_codon:yes gene_type:complete